MASAEAKNVDQRIRDLEKSSDPNAVIMKPKGRETGANLPGLRDPNQSDEQFPTSGLSAQEDMDALMAAKLELQDEAHPGVTKFGVLQAKDSDFEWLRRKREAAEYANFQQWFAQNFDKMDVTQKKLAKQLFPKFYKERLEQLDRSIQLQAKLARLKLLGVEGKDDLLLQYATEAGYIDSDPLEKILHPEQVAARQQDAARRARFARGLLNPNRLLRGDWGQRTRKTNADQLWGPGRGPFASAFGTDNRPFYAGNPAASGAGAGWEGDASAQSQYDFIKQFL